MTARLAAVALLAACAIASAAPVDIPFTRVEHLVVVPVRINGSGPFSFVLDSGSARIVVDANVSRTIGLAEAENDTIGGAGAGRVPARRVHDVAIEVGGLPLRHCEFVAIDLSGVSALTGHAVDGILGHEFLSRFIVTIDYAKQRLQLRDPQSGGAGLGEQLPIRIEKGWPFVRAKLLVNQLEEISDEFLIDSGSNDAVDHPIAQQASERVPISSGNGLGTPVAGFLSKAALLGLGPFELRDLPLNSGGATAQTSKLIGGAVLSRFVVTFDYPHSRIFLLPQAKQ